MVLVFIEIIQLNFCGLSYMTKKNIEQRAKLDSMLIYDENNENTIKNNGDEAINLGEYSIELKQVSTTNSFNLFN